ncbi:hypothetical protein [Sphingomonas sp.]|uniref:hypothetical protein n=1 Tax=Sphingomonas sp. TaxID=28214 RepID=UPI0028AB625D|nr:hypothetical protein [Sphingomonas sp.]
MSSISALSTTSAAMPSPRDRINDRISGAASSGEISATDQSALSTALDSIDSSLASERSSGTKPSGDMKTKMESLIQGQVDNGTLTEDQATELKSMFAKGAGGKHGPHGAHGGKGPEGPPPAQDADADTDASATTTADAAGDAVSQFLKQLRDQAEETTSYSASGDTSRSSSTKSTGLVLDTFA